MKASDIPTKFNIAFGANAGGGYVRSVPQASQIGINDGWASLNDGFVPLNFQPIGSGGVPPFGQDMNGILKQISQWTRWQNAAGSVPYDATFQTAIAGYPTGAVVRSGTTAGLFWYSTADDNVTNPDTGGAGWLAWRVLGSLTANQLFTTFQANGTYTIAASAVKITATGAGGGGAGTNGGVSPQPSGGGAGGTLIKYLTGLTPGNTLAVTVGARGTGGGTANTGGVSVGGDTIVASGTQTITTLTAGGGGGAVSPTGSAGSGGTATNGDINMTGNGGSQGGASGGIGGIAQPFAPFGDGGGVPLNGAVINGHTQTNQDGAQGIVTIEAVG